MLTTRDNSNGTTSGIAAGEILSDLNRRYLERHVEKEEAFWTEKMGLHGHATANFGEKEIALKEFASDPANLDTVRQALASDTLSEQEQVGLRGWERYFAVNQIEKQEARDYYRELVATEGNLERDRGSMRLGYTDPDSGDFVEASSVELALKLRADKDEAMRRAAFEGLRSIEPFVLEAGFLDIVRQRNRLARSLGYVDYYDWKVTVNEGFGKDRLFEILDDLRDKTTDACRRSVDDLIDEKGEQATAPWNFAYLTSGDLTAELDPYFPFAESFGRWVRSFAALGVDFGGATLQLDLVDRRGKYSNGFMHGPGPAWLDRDGAFHSARINFTANAVPAQVGSGERATETLFHEGGHAAHFSNIRMPAPCFAQEYSPTSVAFAETQAMFFDSLISDADWLMRYARTADGEQMPVDLARRSAEMKHRLRAWRLRSMLAVCYAEKALYEMSDAELTPENVLEQLRAIEKEMAMIDAAPRPLLSIPHLLSNEASAYYHGYVLAEMAVYQTREWFLQKDGYLTDNPKVGPTLAEQYWQEGNARTFLDFVERLTGRPFSADATERIVNRTLDEVGTEVERLAAEEKERPAYTGSVDLNATIAIVHGDDVIATNADGLTLAELSEQFAAWIEGQ